VVILILLLLLLLLLLESTGGESAYDAGDDGGSESPSGRQCAEFVDGNATVSPVLDRSRLSDTQADSCAEELTGGLVGGQGTSCGEPGRPPLSAR